MSRRIEPGPGQESVWDYPRPPRVEPSARHVRIVFDAQVIAETRRAWRVLETSHPPVYYIPGDDFAPECLYPSTRTSFCEWKGTARYLTVASGERREVDAAWSYPDPTPPFLVIKDFIAVYPGRMDACYVDDERVEPQPGGFYGGWITREIVGPFKGGPGTFGW